MRPGKPLLDPRDADAIVRDLLARVPAYAPGWEPAEGGPGRAVLVAFARQLRALGERLNQAPDKNLLAFLEMLGVSLIPAQAARAPVVFQLLPAVGDSRAPARTRIGAEVPGRDQPVIFETEQAIGLAAGRLVEVASLWPGRDAWASHAAALAAGEPLRLFAGLEPVPHVLYLAHDVHFALAGRSTVELRFSLSGPGRPELPLAWEYWDGEGWRGFKDFRSTDQPGESLDATRGLTRSGLVRLATDCAEAAKATVHGVEAHWLRGRVRAPLPPDPARRLPEVDRIEVRTVIERPPGGDCQQGFAPDAAFAGGTRLDLTKTFQPFGARPDVDSAFYLTSEEVFARPGAAVRICIGVARTPAAEADERGRRYETDVDRVRRLMRDFVRALAGVGREAARFAAAWLVGDVERLRQLTRDLDTALGDFERTGDLTRLAGALRDVVAELLNPELRFAIPDAIVDPQQWQAAFENVRVKLTGLIGDLAGPASGLAGLVGLFNPVAVATQLGNTLDEARSFFDTALADLIDLTTDQWSNRRNNAKSKMESAKNDLQQRFGQIHGLIETLYIQLGEGLAAVQGMSQGLPGVDGALRTWQDIGQWFVGLQERIEAVGTAVQRAGTSFQALLGALFELLLADPTVVAGVVPPTLPPPRLAWEYWDGRRWQRLVEPGDTPAVNLLGSGEVAFTVPDDWAPSEVGGVQARWLRLRLTSGSYSHLRLVSWKDTESDRVNFFPIVEPRPPAVETFLLGYVYRSPWAAPERCLTHNDFAWEDRSAAARWRGTPFAPWRPVADTTPALYLGLDAPLPLARVSLWVDVEEAPEGEPPVPLVWEAWTGRRWEPLAVDDETAHLRRPGMVAFVPGPTTALARFGTERHWVRARRQEDGPAFERHLRALRLNAAWAAQVQTVRDEVVGGSTGLPRQAFFLRQAPVLPGEVIEVRELEGARAAVELPILEENLRQAGLPGDALDVVRDMRTGAVREVWVRWERRPHLFFSGPDDRHYVVERSRGRVIFGDGRHGRIPPPGADNVAARAYRAGGGLDGNLPAGALAVLMGPVPLAQGVVNVRAAEGGADGERLAAVAARGPRTLRHRRQAITAADYEALAREASPEVAVARALPATHPSGRPAPGWVTLIVMPQSRDPRPQPSFELRRRVREFLAARVPAPVAGRVAVVGPTYLPVGVDAAVVPASPADAGPVVQRVRERLADFLQPVTGGPQGEGWPFGRDVYLSDVAAALERVPGVDAVALLHLLLDGTPRGERVPVPPDRIVVAGPVAVRAAGGA
jgi:hypothetical protein